MLIVNKRINFDFNVFQTFEVGVVLTGDEVKSIRTNHIGIVDCYVAIKGRDAWLLNWNIPKYKQSFTNDKYNPRREKKLLLKHSEIVRIIGLMKQKGFTIVVSKCYTNKKGYIKLELALVTGKKKYDKRRYIRQKDERREERKKFAEY